MQIWPTLCITGKLYFAVSSQCVFSKTEMRHFILFSYSREILPPLLIPSVAIPWGTLSNLPINLLDMYEILKVVFVFQQNTDD